MTKEQIALLGTRPDKELADAFGITVSAVCRMRNKKGIAPVSGSGGVGQEHRPWAPNEVALLGTDTDENVAAAIGRSKFAVYAARSARGIPGYLKAGGKYRQRGKI